MFKRRNVVRRKVGGQMTWEVVAVGDATDTPGRHVPGMLVRASNGRFYWTTRLDDFEVVNEKAPDPVEAAINVLSDLLDVPEDNETPISDRIVVAAQNVVNAWHDEHDLREGHHR